MLIKQGIYYLSQTLYCSFSHIFIIIKFLSVGECYIVLMWLPFDWKVFEYHSVLSFLFCFVLFLFMLSSSLESSMKSHKEDDTEEVWKCTQKLCLYLCVFHACHGLAKEETWDNQRRLTREAVQNLLPMLIATLWLCDLGQAALHLCDSGSSTLNTDQSCLLYRAVVRIKWVSTYKALAVVYNFPTYLQII